MVQRLRDARGFGLIEMMIALTVLAIATTALTGVFVTGHVTLRRAAQSDSAAVLADKLLERFRAETWDSIALSSSSVTSALNDTAYSSDPALNDASMPASLRQDITDANAPAPANGAGAASCANTPTPIPCMPTRSIPDTSQTPTEVAPDGRSYRLDTYVTWGCPDPSETLGGTMNAPTCSSGATVLPYAPVKVVTVVVRDATSSTTLNGTPVYRTSTTFDRLGGGSMPAVTVAPSGSGSDTTTTAPPPVTGAPNPPTAAPTFVNGTGSGSPCPCITSTNESALSFDVQLPSTSLASDTVKLTLSDGNPNDTQTQTTSATQGAGIVHFTQINHSSLNGTTLADGTITVSAVAKNTSGESAPTSTTTIKDTHGPTGLSVTSPTDGATGVAVAGPFNGTAGVASGDRTTVTLEFCQAATWTCTTPDKTATANVDGSGSWSVTLASKLQTNHAYTLEIVQQDSAGNTSKSPDFHFST